MFDLAREVSFGTLNIIFYQEVGKTEGSRNRDSTVAQFTIKQKNKTKQNKTKQKNIILHCLLL